MNPVVEIRSAGSRKQAIHFGARERPLFGFYHPPANGASRAGVVLCNPIGTDQTRSERAYRHLAERLSKAGFACLRFDLFCTGDSGGDEMSPGLVRAWVEDIGTAADELRALSGARAIALVGLRLGATLALLSAADRGDVDALVLWSPCVSGAAFVSEVTRLHKLYSRIEPQMAGAPAPPAGGEEALGLFLPDAVIEELSRIDLLQTTRRPARQTLVIDGGNVPGLEALLPRLRELGAGPELRLHPGQKFLTTVPHRALLPEELIDSIVGWLAEAYPARLATPVARPDKATPAPSNERPLVFGDSHPLFGILTPAAPGRARPGRPGIVLTNAGCVNRVGPHRTYVKLARRWAQLGFDVLRVDLAGIGDSPAAPGTRENLTYPASGLTDLSEAMRALGPASAIVVGLCSGGDYAFQLGARDQRLAGAWLLNPRTFCVLDLAAVESGTLPSGPVDEVPSALQRMAEGGVDTFLLVSRRDPGVAYVDANASRHMQALAEVPGFKRVDLDGTDHTFTPVAMQERVSHLLTEHLVARYAR